MQDTGSVIMLYLLILRRFYEKNSVMKKSKSLNKKYKGLNKNYMRSICQLISSMSIKIHDICE